MGLVVWAGRGIPLPLLPPGWGEGGGCVVWSVGVSMGMIVEGGIPYSVCFVGMENLMYVVLYVWCP